MSSQHNNSSIRSTSGSEAKLEVDSSQHTTNSTRSTSGSEAGLEVKQGPEKRRNFGHLENAELSSELSSEDQWNDGLLDAKDANSGYDICVLGDEEEDSCPPTTLMIYDIPCRVSLGDLVEAICDHGFEHSFDFLHLPMRRRKKNPKHTSLGYAFINLESPELAASFSHAFKGFHFESMQSTKALSTKRAHLQGRVANEKQFGRKCR